MASWMAFSVLLGAAFAADAGDEETAEDRVQPVIETVERICREGPVHMVGPEKAQRLAELVDKHEPKRVVECGTALGYSALWIARQLERNGGGELITIEIDPDRAKRAEAFFREAGLADRITVKVGDAREVVKTIEGPIDFLFLDCGFSNYETCFRGVESKLADGAVVVADNVGIGARSMAGYLEIVRENHKSHTEWFDIDLPWARRDALEVTVIER
jgi:predicted O-methyltransferase YrrM